jgi:hypothetical protein
MDGVAVRGMLIASEEDDIAPLPPKWIMLAQPPA